jgi:hypothetical protein
MQDAGPNRRINDETRNCNRDCNSLALLVTLTLNVVAQQPDTRDRTIDVQQCRRAWVCAGARHHVFRLADSASRNVSEY